MIPKIDAELRGYPELVARLEGIRRRLRRPQLEPLVPEVRREIADRFDEVWPRLHKTGRLRASLTRGATGGYANLRSRPGEAEVQIGTTLAYAPLVRTDLVLSEDGFPPRAVEEWAALVADRVVGD